MDRDVLQVFTAAFIAELEMDKSRKVDLLEYVSVAGKDELLYYLATGNIATGIIQESKMLTYTENVVESLIQEVSAQDIKDKAKKVGSAIKGAPGKVAQGARNVAFDAQVAARGLKKSIPHRLSGMSKTAREKASAAGGAVKQFAGTKTGKGIGIALAVAAATAASYAAYKKWFSQGAKACKDASDKGACLKQYKKKAAVAKAAALQSGMAKCASSSNPEKCKASIAKKVAKAKAEAAAIG